MSEIAVAGNSDGVLYFFHGELVSGKQILRQPQPMRLYVNEGRDPDFQFKLVTKTRWRQTGDLGHHR